MSWLKENKESKTLINRKHALYINRKKFYHNKALIVTNIEN